MSYFTDKILKAVKQIRRQLDENHIHSFRLGIKHLKALWIFRKWVTGKRIAGKDRKQIRKAFKYSGILRDIQLRHTILEDEHHLLSAEEKTGMVPDLKKARNRFLNQIRKKRLAPKYLSSRIRQWTRFVDRMSEEQLLINGESFYLRGMERLHRLASHLPDDHHALHQIRKEIKHLIYIGQFLEEVAPGPSPWPDRLPALIATAAWIGDWHDQYLLHSCSHGGDPTDESAAVAVEQVKIKAVRGIHQLLGLNDA